MTPHTAEVVSQYTIASLRVARFISGLHNLRPDSTLDRDKRSATPNHDLLRVDTASQTPVLLRTGGVTGAQPVRSRHDWLPRLTMRTDQGRTPWMMGALRCS